MSEILETFSASALCSGYFRSYGADRLTHRAWSFGIIELLATDKYSFEKRGWYINSVTYKTWRKENSYVTPSCM
jgi:hypothetical protein